MMEILLWVSLLCIAYTYAGYPILITICARIWGRTPEPPCAPDASLPRLSLIVAALNEEAVIARFLENALASDYPAERLEVIVASDGSTDRTAAIVHSYQPRGVRLVDFPVRRGKPAVLNATVPRTGGDVLVFSDANTMLHSTALRSLARWFAIPSVGTVCGWLNLIEGASGRNEDAVYWRYETFLKRQEARLHAVVGANGGIYAMRRSCFTPVPDNTVVEDLVLPLLAYLRHGCRIVFDPQAVAEEVVPERIGSEFHRRVRIGVGGYQAIALLWPLLSLRHRWLAFSFFSHKVLRWICPVMMITALTSNAALAGVPAYRAMLALQLGVYAAAGVGMFVPGRNPAARMLRLVAMFVCMNAALLCGLCTWLTSRPTGMWQRTSRDGEPIQHRV